ncbi:MAG: hypothetical protein FWC51_02920 [Proteobacteria bacterium]|nr:hypothetical protein [Pseudomonadota bacterium]
MKDDEKMFQWGVGLFAAVFVLIAALQVLYRVQDRERKQIRADIVRIQQAYAEASAQFSTDIRPDNLRIIAASMYPNFEPIGFKKNITTNEIPIR